MKCMEAQRMIRPFLQKSLSRTDLKAFLDHVEHCPDCYEELEINLAIYNTFEQEDPVGPGQRRSQADYDFRSRTQAEIRAARHYLHSAGMRLAVSVMIMMAAEFVLFVALVTGIQYKQSETRENTMLYQLLGQRRKVAVSDQNVERLRELSQKAAGYAQGGGRASEGAPESVTEDAPESVTEDAPESVTESAAENVTEGLTEGRAERASESESKGAQKGRRG